MRRITQVSLLNFYIGKVRRTRVSAGCGGGCGKSYTQNTPVVGGAAANNMRAEIAETHRADGMAGDGGASVQTS